jgi:hypothetical protein
MCFSKRQSWWVRGPAALVLLFTLVFIRAAAQSEVSTNNPAASNEVSAVTAAQLQALVQLQTQQEATLKALELTRTEIAGTLASSISNNVVHLKAMSDMLVLQRAQDMKVLRDSNRLVLAIVVGLSGLLLLSILFLNLTSIRAINRLATVFQASTLLPPPEGMGAHVSRQMLLFPGEEGQRQLGSAMIQLQSRIQALEHLATKPTVRSGPPTGAEEGENGSS